MVVSQRAVLCGGTHDIGDALFQLKVAPITVGDHVWIASEAFVGPGVHIGDGCVLGARGCAFSDLEPWTVYRGNPAVRLKERRWRQAAAPVVHGATLEGNDASHTDVARQRDMPVSVTPLGFDFGEADGTAAKRQIREVLAEDRLGDGNALRTRRP